MNANPNVKAEFEFLLTSAVTRFKLLFTNLHESFSTYSSHAIGEAAKTEKSTSVYLQPCLARFSSPSQDDPLPIKL